MLRQFKGELWKRKSCENILVYNVTFMKYVEFAQVLFYGLNSVFNVIYLFCLNKIFPASTFCLFTDFHQGRNDAAAASCLNV